MTRLFLVEVRRLLSRRALHLVGAVLLLGLVLLNGVQFARASKDGGPAADRARVLAEQERDRIRRDYAIERANCEEATRDGQAPSGFECPTLEQMLAQVDDQHFYFEDPRYRMTEARDQVLAAGIIVVVLAFAIGGTFAGAEWSAGTMQALLFWEPRRLRVVAAKLLALAAVVLVAAFAAQLLQIGLSFVTASLRGTFEGVGDGFYSELFGRVARTALLALFAAGTGFGIAGLTRNTGGALGVAFVYFAILETVVRGARPRWQPFLVTNQFAAWVDKKLTIFMPGRQLPNGDFVESPPFVLTGNRAGLTLLVYLLAVVGTMTILFVRRDVT